MKVINYEIVIGLEIHIQLNTESKVFSSESNSYCDNPNSQVSEISMGLPGTLPTLNKNVVDYALMLGLALQCDIDKHSRFDRKNYFYPDMPKGYQITQFHKPICKNGRLEYSDDIHQFSTDIERIHIEEDSGKLVHKSNGLTFIDLNRAGAPLLELVTRPDIRSPHQAYLFMKEIRRIVRYLGISTGNMQEGALRCDANISLMEKGSKKYGTKVEIKNVNSFKFLEHALLFEAERQCDLIDNREKVIAETRYWHENKKKTISMRSKEVNNDYMYIHEPDLPAIIVNNDKIAEIESNLPELPHRKKLRYINDLKITEDFAKIIIDDINKAELYEYLIEVIDDVKSFTAIFVNDILKLIQDDNDINKIKKLRNQLRELFRIYSEDKISNSSLKKVLKEMIESSSDPVEFIKTNDLYLISDEAYIQELIEEVINEKPEIKDQMPNKRYKSEGFLTGQVLKRSKGKANPKIVAKCIKKYL